jgi:hypothetical protein
MSQGKKKRMESMYHLRHYNCEAERCKMKQDSVNLWYQQRVQIPTNLYKKKMKPFNFTARKGFTKKIKKIMTMSLCPSQTCNPVIYFSFSFLQKASIPYIPSFYRSQIKISF